MEKKLSNEFEVEEAVIVTDQESTQQPESGDLSDVAEESEEVPVKDTDLSLELVKKSTPVIPKTLNVYGVLVSEELINQKIEEIKKMKINGVHDKKGIAAVKKAAASMLKLRTQPEKWRKEVTAPITGFTKDLKALTDSFGVLSDKGVAEANKILKPILDEIERLENEAELKKEADLAARKALLIEAGATTIDGNIFTFEYNANLFFNGTLMKEFTDEEWNEQYALVSEAYEVEKARLKAIEDEKERKESLLDEKEQALQDKQVKLHKKELLLSDFVEGADGSWTKGDIVITLEQIKKLDGDEWDAAIADKVEEVKPEPVKSYSDGGSGPVNKPVETSAPLASDFATEDDDEAFFPEDTAEPEIFEEVGAVLTRSLVFSEAKPYVEFMVGDKFKQRIFPNTEAFALASKAGCEANIRYEGAINEQLRFVLIQVV